MMAQAIAILGATGKTGREIVKLLLAKYSDSIHLQLYVRSKKKLLALFPSISSNPRVKIFEGPLSDTDLMVSCLAGAQTIICAIGENENIAGLRVIQDAALSILAALEELSRNKQWPDQRSRDEWEPPLLLLLSSSTWNPRLAAKRPAIVHWLIKTAFHHPYMDLLAAQSLLLQAPKVVHVLLVQPPAIFEGEARGHEISTEAVRLGVTYPDLAAGFVELALAESSRELDAVGVSSQGPDNFIKHAPEILRRVVKGMAAQYVPGFWTMESAVRAVFSFFWPER